MGEDPMIDHLITKENGSVADGKSCAVSRIAARDPSVFRKASTSVPVKPMPSADLPLIRIANARKPQNQMTRSSRNSSNPEDWRLSSNLFRLCIFLRTHLRKSFTREL